MNYKDPINILEFIQFQKTVLRKYKNYISEQIKDNYKKVALLVYWLNDYINYIKNEKSFEPNRNIKYKRGQIVFVNFGFRIGNELGGRHYAIVLDQNNAPYERTLTVIPLRSNKNKNTRYHRIYTIALSSNIKASLYAKATSIIDANFKRLIEIGKQIYNSTSPLDKKTLEKEGAYLKKRSKLAKDILDFAKKLNNGSIADVGQITTISKQRIVHPCKKNDVLTDIIVNSNDMELIEQKIKYLYFTS